MNLYEQTKADLEQWAERWNYETDKLPLFGRIDLPYMRCIRVVSHTSVIASMNHVTVEIGHRHFSDRTRHMWRSMKITSTRPFSGAVLSAKVAEVLANAKEESERSAAKSLAIKERRNRDQSAVSEFGFDLHGNSTVSILDSIYTIDSDYRVVMPHQVFDTAAEAASFAKELQSLLERFGRE